jgi:hypothetical protein
MGEVIWVEILSRHRDVTARYRFTGPQVRVGRGYDNDVVIDDPFVAANHVLIARDETGRLVAEDLGSANGMFLDRDKGRLARIVVDGERPIRIGHTYLRVRDASHAVLHERTAGPEARFLPLAAIAALGAMILGIEVLSAWLTETGEPRLSHYLLPPLYVTGAIVGWVGIWAFAARIVSGRARLGRNLLIALLGVLVFLLYGVFSQFAAFALTWRTLASFEYVAIWCIAGAICFFHLREVGSSRLKLKAASVVALAALAIAVHTLIQSEAFQDSGNQNIARKLMPPALRLAPVHDEGIFFAEIERLKTRLDHDRGEAPGDKPAR